MIVIERPHCTVRVYPHDDPDNGAAVGYVATSFPLRVVTAARHEKPGCATVYMPTTKSLIAETTRDAADLGYVMNNAVWRAMIDREMMRVCYGEAILNGRSPSLEHDARLRHVGLDQRIYEATIVLSAMRARNMLPVCSAMPRDMRTIVEIVVSHYFDVVKQFRHSIYKVT